jgi:hypothetical protein
MRHTSDNPERRCLRLVGHSTLDGRGDTMQLMLKEPFLYVGHMGESDMGTSVLDVSDPSRPRIVHQIERPPNVHSHKVQLAGDVLMANFEHIGPGPADRVGLQLYDVSDPAAPAALGFFETGGKGVHRMWYTGGPYTYVSMHPAGFVDRIFAILDVSDPTHPTEVSRWWLDGMWAAGGEEPTWPPDQRYGAHHAVVRGDRAYLGFWDAGVMILDIANRAQPRPVSSLSWAPDAGGATHTALPLPERDLLIVTDESIAHHCREPRKHVRIVDISDEEAPAVIAKCPVPEGDFCERGLRFGPHNLHENRPGTLIDDQHIYVTYFNAGLRVFDISVPAAPREVAYFIPEAPPGQAAIQINDVLVDAEGLIYVSDRHRGGVYILEWPA